MSLEQAGTLAIILSAVVAAISLAVSTWTRVSEARSNKLAKWRRTIVQQVFQKAGAETISFDSVLQKFRSESVGYEKYKVRADEMSAEILRGVLIDLVRDEVLSQSPGDVYKLHDREDALRVHEKTSGTMLDQMSNMLAQKPSDGGSSVMDMMNGLLGSEMMKMTAIMNQDYAVRNRLYNMVSEHPFRYTVGDIAGKIASAAEVDFDVVKSRVLQLIGNKSFSTDSQGRVGLGTEPLESPPIGLGER